MSFDPNPTLAKSGRSAWVTGWTRSIVLTILLAKGVSLLAHRATGEAKNLYISAALLALYPLMNGLLGAFFWRRLRPSVGQLALASLGMSVAYLALPLVVRHKHVVGHIILSLLFFLVMFGAACLGRALFKTDDPSADVSQSM